MQRKDALQHILDIYNPTPGDYHAFFDKGATMDTLPHELAYEMQQHPMEAIMSFGDGNNVINPDGTYGKINDDVCNHFNNFRITPRKEGLTFDLEFTGADDEIKGSPDYNKLSKYVITLSPREINLPELTRQQSEPPLVQKMAEAIAENPEFVNWDGSFSEKYFEKHPKEAKKEAIREKSGLNNTVVEYGIGGSLKSDFAKNAGIVVVNFDEKSDVGKALRDNVADIEDTIGDNLGLPDSNEQHIFVSKDVVVGKNAAVAVLYSDTNGASVEDFETSLRDTIDSVARNNAVSTDSFNIDSNHYTALESQVKNAKDRYDSNDGTWIKKADVSITPSYDNALLDETLVKETFKEVNGYEM